MEEMDRVMQRARYRSLLIGFLLPVIVATANADLVELYRETLSSLYYDVDHDQQYWNMHEYWQTPEETLTAGGGDCEDLALLWHSVLRERGYTASLLIIRTGEGTLHVLVRQGGRIYDPATRGVMPLKMHNLLHIEEVIETVDIAWETYRRRYR